MVLKKTTPTPQASDTISDGPQHRRAHIHRKLIILVVVSVLFLVLETVLPLRRLERESRGEIEKVEQLMRSITNKEEITENHNNRTDKMAVDTEIFHRRMLFFCHCDEKPTLSTAGVFSLALKRMPDLIPRAHLITHTVQTQRMGDSDSANTSTLYCENEVERLIAHQEKQEYSGDVAAPAVDIFYSERFDSVCHKSRKVSISTKVGVALQNLINHSASWVGGAHLVDYLQEIPTRNLRDWGEVFSSKNVNCNPADSNTLHLYRSRGITHNQEVHCNVIHVPTIIRWALDIHAKRTQDLNANETLREMLTHQLTFDEAKSELKRKTKFCGLVTLTTWKSFYAVDALVRHALCRLLTRKYKTCDALAAWKGALKGYQRTSPSDTYKIQKDHKFIIAMANEFSDGYLVEKMIHPYLAHSIAISGSPNLGMYVNDKRPVICSVPQKDLDYVDKWKRNKGEAWMPFNTTPEDWEKDPTIQPIPFHLENDEPLLEFIADRWEQALQPCIDEIVRLDKDDESYVAKLMEPFITNFEDSLFDGTYVGAAVLKWLSHMKSPVTVGIADMIAKLS